MDENPGGSPNLSSPMPEQPMEPNAPEQAVVGSDPNSGNITDQQVAPETSKAGGKKNKAWIFALIGLLVAVIGAVVVAIVVINPFKQEDKVTAAISKIMSGDAPQKVALKGNITFDITDPDMDITGITIGLDSGMDFEKTAGFTNSTIAFNLVNGINLEFGIDEVYTEGGDIYLKPTGLRSMIEQLLSSVNGNENLDSEDYDITTDVDCNGMYDELNCDVNDVNCIDGSYTDCIVERPVIDPGFASILQFIEILDDEWIRISLSSLEDASGMFDVNVSTGCLPEIVDNFSSFGKDIKNRYDENKFITSSTENLKITQKSNPLYHVGLNNEKLTGFINSMSDSEIVKFMADNCGDNATINNKVYTIAEISEITKQMPEVYVEIDNNNNFTRFYLEAAASDDFTANVTVDIDIVYPDNITVNEPSEYTDLMELLQNIIMQMLGYDGDFDYGFDYGYDDGDYGFDIDYDEYDYLYE